MGYIDDEEFEADLRDLHDNAGGTCPHCGSVDIECWNDKGDPMCGSCEKEL